MIALRARGKHYRDIASEIGVATTSVSRHMKQMGFDRYSPPPILERIPDIDALTALPPYVDIPDQAIITEPEEVPVTATLEGYDALDFLNMVALMVDQAERREQHLDEVEARLDTMQSEIDQWVAEVERLDAEVKRLTGGTLAAEAGYKAVVERMRTVTRDVERKELDRNN
jgi:uncharacterized small protein (DUF1192 family)